MRRRIDGGVLSKIVEKESIEDRGGRRSTSS